MYDLCHLCTSATSLTIVLYTCVGRKPGLSGPSASGPASCLRCSSHRGLAVLAFWVLRVLRVLWGLELPSGFTEERRPALGNPRLLRGTLAFCRVPSSLPRAFAFEEGAWARSHAQLALRALRVRWSARLRRRTRCLIIFQGPSTLRKPMILSVMM